MFLAGLATRPLRGFGNKILATQRAMTLGPGSGTNT